MLLWIMAAIGACFTLSAQASGTMARYGGRRFYAEQPRGPRRIVRADDAEAFRDGLVLRWAAIALLTLLGVVVAVAERLGYFSS